MPYRLMKFYMSGADLSGHLIHASESEDVLPTAKTGNIISLLWKISVISLGCYVLTVPHVCLRPVEGPKRTRKIGLPQVSLKEFPEGIKNHW